MAQETNPTLDEILNEPIVRKLMKADGVKARDVRKLYGSLDDDGENLVAHGRAERITDSYAPA